ncbi:1-acyl-sn-glycerol-3-phosphate acyltransferase [Mycoplasma flocculare]|uniref:1-acyl-snN-glycerol-3-phosphate acyltransferase n=1 Tax=Mesomycoplasma flocculare ATCC 27399 TaxID=743971 RepID=A0A0A8ED70_MESFC|nr:lysophospholipid acyltransferase family protein [Mesomycoplasma flocculare]AJC50091.1 1-acyl-snN-glycerol-3-phosphate acyltransferase [Mesomycoplasma flocculare ATCC 27399]ENX50806.1 1-acyl-sn-glycerol-3-phosphate acyltransferase [Mesomycoplasma flocculare ATCC 27716]MXR13769.1 1-acyl-sn-glycerol-3-phosphate acyltransferase [Mesomycoplasma flocculare]MXR23115.1 1-acyl-sn-glycerol-3-phosphate acyltransferase [Mesomycoplasma flocculare]MXR56292.1 1-acyl-sn-glycerol-3-phosphate acyltransferase
MKIKFRIVIFSLLWLLKLRKIRSVWKKYTKNKVELSPEFRSDLILKYSKFILKLFQVKIKVFGYENLPKNAAIIVANHNSFADYFILFAALENHEKGEGEINPILSFVLEKKWYNHKNKWIFYSLDSIFLGDNQKNNSLELNKFLKSVREKRAFGIVFSKEADKNQVFEFPIDIFSAAKKVGLSFIPVTINFSDKDSYKSIRKKTQNVEIFIHKPIKTAAVFSQSSKSLFLAAKKAIFESYSGEK